MVRVSGSISTNKGMLFVRTMDSGVAKNVKDGVITPAEPSGISAWMDSTSASVPEFTPIPYLHPQYDENSSSKVLTFSPSMSCIFSNTFSHSL